jgi:RNA polymerase nonessential primary-like sigma factor
MNAKEKRSYVLGQVLSPVEKQVITLRYGIGIPKPQTLSQVGHIMKLKPHSVNAIQTKALTTLRKHPMVQHLRDYLTIGDDV